MTDRRTRTLLFALLVTGLLALSLLPTTGLSSPATTPVGATHPAGPTLAAAVHGPPSPPHPSVSCTNFPVYTELNNNTWPLDPDFYLQNPCAPIAEDEIHATFASPGAHSGDRWTVPWYLPPESSGGQENATSGIYLGMVVAGDPHSEWNQSYLELEATPVQLTSGFNWTIAVAVLSLTNASLSGTTACDVALEMSWNYSYYCEFDDLANNDPIPLLNVPGGTWLNATFDGTPSSEQGITIWTNATNRANLTANVTLSLSRTGTHAFDPAYATACVDACELNWAQDPSTGSGLTYGLGVGIDVCPQFIAAYAYCDSYNGSRWANLTAPELGIPLYWNGTAYAGQYRYFSPESASGVCNAAAPLGVIVGICNEFTSAGGEGFYPYFALNGNGTASALTFGTSQPTTRYDFGGAYREFTGSSGAQDLVPLAISGLADTSRGGYVPNNTPFNVSAFVTALGTVANVTIAWTNSTAGWTTSPMARTFGTDEDGSYLAAIAGGVNAPIRYFVNATDTAGAVVSNGPRTVIAGPIPKFNVVVDISPPTCGSVTLNGTVVTNGTTVALLPGAASVSAAGCYPYAFGSWSTTRSLAVGNPSAASTTLQVEGNGTLTANWRYVRPIEQVTIDVLPTTCGTVTVNGTPYTNGNVVGLPFNIPVTLAQTATCAGYVFGGWSVDPSLVVLGGQLTPEGNGTLTANYVTASSSYAVTFDTTPPTCGGIDLAGAGYTDTQTIDLVPGTYTLAPAPCAHYGFTNFTTSGGGVSVAGDTLTVTTGGTVTEINYKLTEMFVATSPATCGGIDLNGTLYGNGADVALQNHSVYSIVGVSCAGHFLESVTGTGGLTVLGSLMLVNGTGSVLIVSFVGVPEVDIGFLTNPTTCGQIELGGTAFSNGGFTTETPGAVLPIAAGACANYGFVQWVPSGGITIVGNLAYLNGSGAIQANFGPLVDILIDTLPATCGAVVFDGTPYTNGGEAVLVSGVTYSLGSTACPHYALSQFESSPFVAIANNSITPSGPSTITAVFEPISYTVAVAVGGAGCGSITVDGAPETTGAHVGLIFGEYPLHEATCLTSGFGGWNTTGGLNVADGHLFVNASGNLTAVFTPIPPSLTIGGAAVGYVGTSVEFVAQVAVLVAPSGYLYLWSFGDGASNTSSSNTTTHAYASSGTYTVTVSVVDPFHRSANATTTIKIEGTSNATSFGSLADGLLAVGAALFVMALVVVFGRRRPPKPASRALPKGPSRPTLGQPRTELVVDPPDGPG